MNKKKLMLMLALMSTVAYGAKEKKAANINLDKTVVYSTTGFVADMRKVAATPTIITSEEIEEKNYNSIPEMLEDVPSITITTGSFGPNLDMRGQGYNLATRNIQILVDGIQMNTLETSHAATPLDIIPIGTVERVEILPGGGSVLYGNGTQGGVINIITKSGKGLRGNFGYRHSSFDGAKNDIQIGNTFGKLDVDLSYSRLDEEGYRRGVHNEADYFQGKLRYNISDDQNVEFKFSKNDSKYRNHSDYLTESELEEDRRQEKGSLSERTINKKDFSLSYNNKISDNLAINMIGFQHEYKGYFGDKKRGAKAKAKYSYGEGKHSGSSVVVGVDYIDNDSTRGETNTFNKTTLGIFAMNNYRYGKFEFNQGFRYDRSDYDIDRHSSIRKPLAGTDKKNNFALEASGAYLYSNTGKVYLRLEKGFTTPPASLITDGINVQENGETVKKYKMNNVKSEKYRSGEIGWSDYMFDNTTINTSLFYTVTEDEIHTAFSGYGFMTSNLGKTERYGAEVTLNHYFGNLTLSETYNYTVANIKEGVEKKYGPGLTVESGADLTGNEIERVPRHNFKVSARYKFNDKFKVNGDVVYTGKAYINNTGLGGKSDSYTVVNLRGSYTLDNGVELYAGINNLLDKKYNDRENYDNYTTGVNEYTYLPAPERNYYAGFRYKF